MPHAADDPDSPIDSYLDELLTTSTSTSIPARRVRGLLAEAEAHLRDDAEAGQRDGMSGPDAEAQAVARFGPAADLAGAEHARGVTPLGALVRQVSLSALVLGGVGALAVGASGVVASVIGAIGGSRVLVGVPPAQVLSASNCARWLAGDAGTHSCAAAAADDWATETVVYRIVLGILGVLAVIAFRWALRHLPHPFGPTLPPTVSDTVALTAFGAAGVWTLGMGVDAIIGSGGNGAGQWLSAAPIALAATVFYAVRLVGRVRRPVTWAAVGPATR